MSTKKKIKSCERESAGQAVSNIAVKRKAIKPKSKNGLIYDRDNWKIWSPLPTVWIVSVPRVGVISAVCHQHAQAVHIKVMPINRPPSTFRGGGVREGLLYGIKQAATAVNVLIDVKKAIRILNESGIQDDMAGVLSVDTHKRLIEIVNTLMDAAYEGGMVELDRALLGLSSLNR